MKNNKFITIFLLIFSVVFLFTCSTFAADDDPDAEFDLLADDIILTPQYPMLNKPARIQIQIENNSNVGLNRSTGASSYIYNFENFTVSSNTPPVISFDNSIDSGDYFYYTYDGKFTSVGEQTLSFKVDRSNLLEEIDETNNEITETVEVINEDYDLAISSFDISIDKPIINEEVLFTIVVKNEGRPGLTSGTGLRFTDNIHVFPVLTKDVIHEFEDFEITSTVIDTYPDLYNAMDEGEVFGYKIYGYFTKKGDKQLSFLINGENKLPEEDTADNLYTDSIKVYYDTDERDDFELYDETVEIISSSSVKVTWETSEDTESKIYYKLYGAKEYYNKKADSNASGTVHTVTLTDLEPIMKYEYYVLSVLETVSEESGKDYFIPLEVVQEETAENEEETESEIMESEEALEEEIIEETVNTNDTKESNKVDENSNSENLEDSKVVIDKIKLQNMNMYTSLRGKIVLKVEDNGEAYYIHPSSQEMYFLGRPDDAFRVMREQGIGISNENLKKIPIGGIEDLFGDDSDGDGLTDMFEDAIGTDKNKKDTDGDGYDDKSELNNGYNPNGTGDVSTSKSFSLASQGKIFLQVEQNGEAWYISPINNKRYFLGRPNDAFNVMRNLGLGISNTNFDNL